jgi:hypothetical protein
VAARNVNLRMPVLRSRARAGFQSTSFFAM